MSGQLVEQWPLMNLGDICEILDRLRKPITKKDRVSGEYPYYGATGIVDYVDGYIFDEKLVLVGEDGAKWCSGDNTAFAVEGKCWVNNHAHVIRPNRNLILDDWLRYFLNFSDLSEYITGVTVPKLNQGKLRGIQVPIPPLNEQQRIVDLLNDTFRNIELKQISVEQNLGQSEALIQSIFDSMFENVDWGSSTFNEVATIKGGKRLPKGHTYSNNKTAHPYISVKDFTSDGTIDTTNLKYIDEETFNQISRYTISSNDLYLSIAGTIGKTGIVPVELDGANLTENACKLIFNEGYDAKFVYYFTKTTSFLNQAGLLTKATGQPKLALTRLKQIVICYPDSLEQERLVKRLDEIVHQSKLVEEKLSQELHNLDELKQSILQEAFNGTL